MQVARVHVEREAFQKGPGRGCYRGWRELGKGPQGANEYQEGRARMPGGPGSGGGAIGAG